MNVEKTKNATVKIIVKKQNSAIFILNIAITIVQFTTPLLHSPSVGAVAVSVTQ
jgi:hypothetical protein